MVLDYEDFVSEVILLSALLNQATAGSFASGTLSSAEDSLCCGEAGEKEKKRARGTMGRGKRGSRRFPLPIVPRALSIFSIIDILMGIPSGSLCGGESFRHAVSTTTNDSAKLFKCCILQLLWKCNSTWNMQLPPFFGQSTYSVSHLRSILILFLIQSLIY